MQSSSWTLRGRSCRSSACGASGATCECSLRSTRPFERQRPSAGRRAAGRAPVCRPRYTGSSSGRRAAVA
eukprot:8902350-Alexandrium_andersonii.AAC.1